MSHQRGAALVEFAIVAGPFFMIVFFILYMSFGLWSYFQGVNYVNQLARYCAESLPPPTSTSVKNVNFYSSCITNAKIIPPNIFQCGGHTLSTSSTIINFTTPDISNVYLLQVSATCPVTTPIPFLTNGFGSIMTVQSTAPLVLYP